MPTIAAVRPVLLSAPYADPDSMEVRRHLPTGWRNDELLAPTAPGLGTTLTADTERRYPFRPDAVYRCLIEEQEVASAWSR